MMELTPRCSALSGVETQPHTVVTPGMLVGMDSRDNVKVSGEEKVKAELPLM